MFARVFSDDRVSHTNNRRWLIIDKNTAAIYHFEETMMIFNILSTLKKLNLYYKSQLIINVITETKLNAKRPQTRWLR